MGPVGLMVCAAHNEDWLGFSTMLVLSITSTMISAVYHSYHAYPIATPLEPTGPCQGGDIAEKPAKGCFLIVHYQERIAKEVYFNQEITFTLLTSGRHNLLAVLIELCSSSSPLSLFGIVTGKFSGEHLYPNLC